MTGERTCEQYEGRRSRRGLRRRVRRRPGRPLRRREGTGLHVGAVVAERRLVGTRFSLPLPCSIRESLLRSIVRKDSRWTRWRRARMAGLSYYKVQFYFRSSAALARSRAHEQKWRSSCFRDRTRSPSRVSCICK